MKKVICHLLLLVFATACSATETPVSLDKGGRELEEDALAFDELRDLPTMSDETEGASDLADIEDGNDHASVDDLSPGDETSQEWAVVIEKCDASFNACTEDFSYVSARAWVRVEVIGDLLDTDCTLRVERDGETVGICGGKDCGVVLSFDPETLFTTLTGRAMCGGEEKSKTRTVPVFIKHSEKQAACVKWGEWKRQAQKAPSWHADSVVVQGQSDPHVFLLRHPGLELWHLYPTDKGEMATEIVNVPYSGPLTMELGAEMTSDGTLHVLFWGAWPDEPPGWFHVVGREGSWSVEKVMATVTDGLWPPHAAVAAQDDGSLIALLPRTGLPPPEVCLELQPEAMQDLCTLECVSEACNFILQWKPGEGWRVLRKKVEAHFDWTPVQMVSRVGTWPIGMIKYEGRVTLFVISDGIYNPIAEIEFEKPDALYSMGLRADGVTLDVIRSTSKYFERIQVPVGGVPTREEIPWDALFAEAAGFSGFVVGGYPPSLIENASREDALGRLHATWIYQETPAAATPRRVLVYVAQYGASPDNPWTAQVLPLEPGERISDRPNPALALSRDGSVFIVAGTKRPQGPDGPTVDQINVWSRPCVEWLE